MPHREVEKTLAAWREAERRAATASVGSDAHVCAQHDVITCRAAYQDAVRSLPTSLVDEPISVAAGVGLDQDE
jgi:hypothetical protein